MLRFHRPHLLGGLLLATALAAGGCASSPDVKMASTRMTQALGELQGSISAFQRLYLSEIEKTRDEIGAAIVARSVRGRIAELSQSFDEPEWREKFQRHGLIALSEEIEATQDSALRMVRLVASERPEGEETGAAALERIALGQAQNLRTSAEALRQSGLETEAVELERRAAEIEADAGTLFRDPINQAYFEALLELGASQAEIPQNLAQLKALVRVLQQTHAVVHDWVMTDVSVSGEEVAGLLEKHAATLGLGGGGS